MSQRSISLGLSSAGTSSISVQGTCIPYDSSSIIVSSINNGNLFIVNTINGTTTYIRNSDVGYRNNVGLPYNQPICVYNNYLYMLNSTNPAYAGTVDCRISRVNLTNTADVSFNMMPSFPFRGLGATFIDPYIYHYHVTNRVIYRVDLRSFPLTAVHLITAPTVTGLISGTYSQAVSTLTSNNIDTLYGVGYYSGAVNKNAVPPGMFKYNITANTLIQPFTLMPSNHNFFTGSYWDMMFGSVFYNNTVYVPTQYTANVYAFKTETAGSVSVYSKHNPSMSNGCALVNGNLFAAQGATLQILSLPPPPVYTVPPPPTITSAISNSARSLSVTLFDASNTVANEVKYVYSMTGTTYADTGVAYTGATTYNFTITQNETGGLLTDISYTLYVKAQNGGLVSGNATTANVVVFQTPRTPGQVSFTLVGSGNVQVSINESSPTPPNFYYLNNVSYHLYAYNTFGGTNLSGNTSLLVYNRPVGILSNTNTTYTPVVSYVNTGLNANTYTMYVIARNNVGNSNPVFANVSVFTTPLAPFIDTGNTVPTSLGNLQVSIIDPSNVSRNGITYWYSTNGNTYINSNIANNGPTQTRYTFTIPGLSSSVNTIYVYAKNSVGTSTLISTPVNITGVPGSITSYSTDFSFENGITVSILDTNNRASDNIYYYYYIFRTGDTAPNQSGNISVYSNSYVSLTSGSSVSSFNIPNLMKGDYTVYVAAVNSYGSSIYTPAITPISVICFKEDSRILTNKGYKKIQHLKKGDLVKTLKHGFKPIYKIGKKEIVHMPTEERSKNHLYKCSPSQYPDLFEDLVITGCHSILVDGYVNEEQVAKTIEVNGRIYLTEGKYRVPVCADNRATIYEKAGKYMVYHIALENDDYYMNYGIYANGLLVESTSKRFLDEMNIMETYQ